MEQYIKLARNTLPIQRPKYLGTNESMFKIIMLWALLRDFKVNMSVRRSAVQKKCRGEKNLYNIR